MFYHKMPIFLLLASNKDLKKGKQIEMKHFKKLKPWMSVCLLWSQNGSVDTVSNNMDTDYTHLAKIRCILNFISYYKHKKTL